MKHILIFALILVFSNLHAQVTELELFKKQKDSKISLGMSPSEVKTKLGAPKSVDSGFPAHDGIFISEFPELRGQFNNSTWSYFYDPISINIKLVAGYYINDKKVTEKTYYEYIDKDFVYMAYGDVIDMEGAHGYQITKNKNLTKEAINKETTRIVDGGTKKTYAIPVYCVIFDKGTQSVATTRAYFLKN